MLSLGPLAFAAPWMLLALAVLPVLWWLLKLMPPAPRHLRFPAIRLLFDLDSREETPDRTPLWLILLRLLLAALVILALAHPLINSSPRLPGSGPLLLAVDDGWAAAARWAARAEAMAGLIAQAEREGRAVVLVTTAPRTDGQPAAATAPLVAAEARRLAQAVLPQPWPTDRAAVLAALDGLDFGGAASVVWLSDGLASADPETDSAFALRLQHLGSLRVLGEPAPELALLLQPPAAGPSGLTLRVARAAPAGERTVAVRGSGEDGRPILREELRFAAGATAAEATLTLPVELRNRLVRLSVEGEDSAGAVVLLDERWRQRPVGLVSGGAEDEAQPLLSDLYYLERALAPFSEVRRGTIAALLQRELAVVVLSDVGALTQDEANRFGAWIEGGGVLLRFAGPRLAQNADALLPVRLRAGDRTLGGAMSWTRPARLAPFPAGGPFAGLAVPADVEIRRQVLAEPEIDLGDKTWARLDDGTPLITGERRGEGWLVLVHTTADTDWSSLSLSGLYVEMLRRLVALSQGVVATGGGDEPLPPLETLDGFGRPMAPPPLAAPAAPATIAAGAVGPRHPPGYYGRETARRALNLSAGVAAPRPLGRLPAGVAAAPFARSAEIDLKPWLLAGALVLLLADIAIALALRGLLTGPRMRRAAAALALALWLPAAAAAAAPDAEAFALAAVAETRLAYVRTGVPAVDATSNAGLLGLGVVLNRRTSVEPPPPLGVDVETDELAFFPLLYWPVTAEQATPSDAALRRLNAYLKNGGTILFDTRDQNAGGTFGGAGPGTQALRELVRGLDIPPLIPAPPDHVLTKSFYLMQSFPGRWAGGTVWVEESQGQVNDGVSSVIVGSNDWAGAWAVDDVGRPLFPTVPGGERQRELAYRFGVNLVMYALTGNYKSDQVHVPAILERLGQ